jgi:tetratricopeptide (TPR) repeat protein
MVQTGLAHHLANQVEPAERLYRQVLAIEPSHPDALHLLGVLVAQRGEHQQALPMLQQAVALVPMIGEFHRHLADVYALLNRHAEAFDVYVKAIQLDPNDVLSLYAAARSAAQLGRDAQAAECLQRLTQLQPNSATTWADFGIVLTRLNQLPQSVEALQRSIAIESTGHALTGLSDALRQLNRVDEATEPARRGAELQPEVAWAQIAYGNVLQVLARFDEAVDHYRKALAIEPGHFDAINNLGLTLLKMGQPVEALKTWDEAVEKHPDNANLRANRSLAILTLGNLARGFAEYESRFESLAFRSTPQPSKPRWRGEDVRGKTILLSSEQGLGDTIHFARYVPMIAQTGARVVIACPPEIKDLLLTVKGVAEVRSRGDADPQFDYWVPMASLPFHFKTTLENVPAEVPYLHADAARIEKWRSRLAGEGIFKVGIVWAGSPLHQNDRSRTCRLEQFFPLARIEGVRLFSLQKGPAAQAVLGAPAELKLTALGDELRDFSDTAAVLEALDLLIAVDTSVVHLAGALGRPVWTLLAHGPDWRWLMEREDSPWYPTMRLIRQPKVHDWKSVFERLERELRAHVEKSKM